MSCNSCTSFVSNPALGVTIGTSGIPAVDTPPESPQLKILTLPASSEQDAPTIEPGVRKPNRPYSYYVATNFHPFDLSLLANMESSEMEKPAAAEPAGPAPVTTRRSSRQKQQTSAETSSSTGKKRLSVSLNDIKSTKSAVAAKPPSANTSLSHKTLNIFKTLNNSAGKKSNQSQRSSSFHRSECLIVHTDQQTPAATTFTSQNRNLSSLGAKAKSTTRIGRFNRFFRHLFRGHQHNSLR